MDDRQKKFRNASLHGLHVKSHTSEIADEVIELHLSVWFDVLVVEISVEHDNGKCQQEHSVSAAELSYHIRVTFGIAASKRLPHTDRHMHSYTYKMGQKSKPHCFSIQCFDAIGWIQEAHPTCRKPKIQRLVFRISGIIWSKS